MLRKRRKAILILIGLAAIIGVTGGALVAADRGDGQSGGDASPAHGLRACEDTKATPVPRPTAAQTAGGGAG